MSMMDRATATRLTYIVANHYIEAIDYMHAHDLSPFETRFISHAHMLNGLVKPKVIVLGAADKVSENIIEMLALREAEVTYAG